MILIVAGTRTIDDYDYVESIVTSSRHWKPDKIISGGAAGPDTYAEAIAAVNGIDFEQYPAEWDELGKAAGPIRNREMAKAADALVAIWNGHSAGTKSMISVAIEENVPTDWVLTPRDEWW